MISVSTVNTLLLALALLAGSLSVIPVLPVVFVLAAAWFTALAVLTFRVPRLNGPQKWYVLYGGLSLLYCVAIGVDLFDWRLYRRELKFLVPFLAFVIFSSLKYRPGTDRRIVTTFVLLGAMHAALFAISPLLLNVDLSSVYVDNGGIWDRYGEGSIYLGWFISHTAAGGWMSAAALFGFGVLESSELSRRTRVRVRLAVGVFLVLLVLCWSRAFMLATLVVMLHVLIGTRLKPTLYAALVAIMVAMGSAAAVPYLRGELAATSLGTLVDADASVARYNVLARYVLWEQAYEDFVNSPIIGVGVSRFDDNARVIATFPTRSRPIEDAPLYPEYFESTLVRVNVDEAEVHTDQSAHNMYLQVLAEGGVILLTLLVVLIASTVLLMKRVATAKMGIVSDLARGVWYAIYGVLVAATFGNSYLNLIPMFFLLSVAGYVSAVAGAEGPYAARRPERRGVPEAVLASTLPPSTGTGIARA